ncbi:MAG TPA: sialidase family protein [Gemmatimonadaceae bacterium]|nr:sialidase family protein [Gemmatimonadaceae bacterium]
MTAARRLTVMILGALGLSVVSCSHGEIAWNEIRLGGPRLPRMVALGSVSPQAAGCPASLRATRNGSRLLAAWWSARSDSSGVLRVSESLDGGKTWTPPVVADSTDRSARGCGRPPPSIAADSSTGYVYLAYFAEPPGGRGVFFAHSMDSARTFHAPVPIVFGATPAWVSVSAAGDRVAVAYEDPNSVTPSVGVAVSRSMGHIFEAGEIVSGANQRARQPTVQVVGDTVRVWWSDHSADPRVSATRPAYRDGVWR